jgi:hypothetical protein
LFIAKTPLGSLVFRWELSNRMIALRPNAKALRREGLNGPNNLRFIYNQRKRPERDVNLSPYNAIHNRRNLGRDFAPGLVTFDYRRSVALVRQTSHVIITGCERRTLPFP